MSETEEEFRNPFAERTKDAKLASDYDKRRKTTHLNWVIAEESPAKRGSPVPRSKCPNCATGVFYRMRDNKALEQCNNKDCGKIRGPKPEDVLCVTCEKRRASTGKQPKYDKFQDYLCDVCSKKTAKRLKST